MTLIRIYFIGLVVIPIAFALINRYYRFVSKDDVTEDELWAMAMFVVVWPLVLAFGAIVGVCYGFYHFTFPDKEETSEPNKEKK